MIIIGCDLHTRLQQIAMFDATTGEIAERCLDHENGDVERLYGTLSSAARVGIEATVSAPRFERILTRFHHELWVGDATEIRAARVRKQKTDSRDAQHILDLLLDQFNSWIAELNREVQQQAERYPEAICLMKQPGVGPVTALCFVLTKGRSADSRAANRW